MRPADQGIRGVGRDVAVAAAHGLPATTPAFYTCMTVVERRSSVGVVGNTIGFRPTEEDERIIKAAMRPDERTSDVIRRALRLLEREVWLAQAREDAERLTVEDLSGEADAW